MRTAANQLRQQLIADPLPAAIWIDRDIANLKFIPALG
jgi:hypothetical protein